MPSLLIALIFSAMSAAPRERAVMIYPRERVWFRPAFYNAHQRELQHQLQKRFDLEVHEQVATDDALFGIDVRGAKLLVLSAHGCAFAMSFDGPDQWTLDSSDQRRLEKFLSQLAPDATIILQSCETGLGFAWIVKQAAGPHRRVIAAEGWVPRNGLDLTSIEPVDVKITCRDKHGESWDCTIRL